MPELASLRRALNTSFRVHLDGAATADLTLVEIQALRSRPGWESFSLRFMGPDAPAFWQGTFPVEHAEIGSFPMFLVAVLTEGDGQRYQAIFNRPVERPASHP
jgi:hypothetical protein